MTEPKSRTLVGHGLLAINIALVVLAIASSYYRYMVLHDYTVAYEGDCDPETQSCFSDCADDECTELYYFSIIERQANEIENLCGSEVTTCDAAYNCTNVESCTITFCDPSVDGADACNTDFTEL
jgi:hypothetical protein